MAMGLSEAAAATGVNRWTIYRAWKAGRISANRTETGQIEVDPAELFRVFPPIAVQEAGTARAPRRTGQRNRRQCMRVRVEVEVKLLHEMLDEMREDRNAWREQASKVTAALPSPASSPETRRPWWRRLVS